jgi:hypothetical protein
MNHKKHRYTVKARKGEVLNGKTTEISWDELVKVLSINEVSKVEKIRYEHKGHPNGTAQIDSSAMLQLWRTVTKRKATPK